MKFNKKGASFDDFLIEDVTLINNNIVVLTSLGYMMETVNLTVGYYNSIHGPIDWTRF
jgi:hypothetical protein